MRPPARLLVAVALVVTAATPSLVDAAPACPSPRTCGDFALTEGRWRVAPGATLVIPYRVNPVNAWVPEADVPAMVRAAATTWERANPRVRFRYDGVTDALPGRQDGLNVVGWGVPLLPQEAAHADRFLDPSGAIVEADVVLNATVPTTWQPCEQRDGGCAGHADEIAPGTFTGEVQGLVTHELGHWLSLDHPDTHLGVELTMHDTSDPQRGLEYQTLGLGDVRGVRAAYPCGRCGGPPRVVAP